MEYLKKSTAPVAANDERIQETVKTMLARIEADGENAVREYAVQFENWPGEFILTDDKRAELIARVPGMEGHARACDWRLRKYFPEKEWDVPVYDQKHYE